MGQFGDYLGTIYNAFKIGKASLSASGVSAARTITIQDSSHTLVGRDTTDTLENKRNKKRVFTDDTLATLTPEIADYDIFVLTAQDQALTIANPSSSTMAEGEMILIEILDDGTPRAISYGNQYEDFADTKATTTTASKWLWQLWKWNSTDNVFYLAYQEVQP